MKTLLRIVLKGLLLFLLIDLAFGFGGNLRMGNLSLYNRAFPGRQRFPFGETPQQAYNFSLSDLDAMFASHIVSQSKPADEFRVLVIGDSSVWGTLLKPEETLTGQLNAAGLAAPDGRRLRFYNLGYPTNSVVKDLMILERARQYQPDALIWLVTLEALARDTAANGPLVEDNPRAFNALDADLQLSWYPGKNPGPSFWSSTLIGQRKRLADLIRLQVYGVMWAATGVDQVYPKEYTHALVDLEASADFHGVDRWEEGYLPRYLALETIPAVKKMLGKTPVLIVNEPILISRGKNSDLRYDFYYPRWAYDRYMHEMEATTSEYGISYLNTWDIVPPEEFTNSAIHIDRTGEETLAAAIAPRLQSLLAGGVGQ
jgi:hypothetical protein